MEKERQVARIEQPGVERDDVRVAGNRCPYCHEQVDRASADVCRECLARHHPACWTEATRCGACRSEHALRSHPAPDERCESGNCAVRAVARGDGSDSLYCRPHAEALRRLGARSALFAQLVTLPLLVLGVVGVAAGVHLLAWISLGGGVLLYCGGALQQREVSLLPPLPPERV